MLGGEKGGGLGEWWRVHPRSELGRGGGGGGGGGEAHRSRSNAKRLLQLYLLVGRYI